MSYNQQPRKVLRQVTEPCHFSSCPVTYAIIVAARFGLIQGLASHVDKASKYEEIVRLARADPEKTLRWNEPEFPIICGKGSRDETHHCPDPARPAFRHQVQEAIRRLAFDSSLALPLTVSSLRDVKTEDIAGSKSGDIFSPAAARTSHVPRSLKLHPKTVDAYMVAHPRPGLKSPRRSACKELRRLRLDGKLDFYDRPTGSGSYYNSAVNSSEPSQHIKHEDTEASMAAHLGPDVKEARAAATRALRKVHGEGKMDSDPGPAADEASELKWPSNLRTVASFADALMSINTYRLSQKLRDQLLEVNAGGSRDEPTFHTYACKNKVHGCGFFALRYSNLVSHQRACDRRLASSSGPPSWPRPSKLRNPGLTPRARQQAVRHLSTACRFRGPPGGELEPVPWAHTRCSATLVDTDMLLRRARGVFPLLSGTLGRAPRSAVIGSSYRKTRTVKSLSAFLIMEGFVNVFASYGAGSLMG